MCVMMSARTSLERMGRMYVCVAVCVSCVVCMYADGRIAV